MVEQSSLRLASGGSTPTPALQDFYIENINHTNASMFVEKWHYSKKMPTGKNINYGLFHKGALYAVIVYGIGVNPYQAEFLGVKNIIEIKRMCRSEPKKKYPLSRLIAITARMVKEVFDYDAIVAFSDPEHGHEGTVYKAAGFTHEGMTNAEWHLIKDGEKFHRRHAFRYARRNNIHISEAREILGMERVKTEPKHRWVRRVPVGSRRTEKEKHDNAPRPEDRMKISGIKEDNGE